MGFVVSIAVIFFYYVLIQLGDGIAKQGNLSPSLAMWMPNVALGVAGLALLMRNARESSAVFPAHRACYQERHPKLGRLVGRARPIQRLHPKTSFAAVRDRSS